MRILYFDCASGISGDMVIGALLDAGLSLDTLRKELMKLRLAKFDISKRNVRRGELRGTKFDVIMRSPAEGDEIHRHRSFKDIIKLIDNSRLKKNVKANAKKVFHNLADAEKRAHGIRGEDVHFHQLGEADSIIDIVGACIGFGLLGIDRFYSSAVVSGTGLIRDRHGLLPNPGPAALNLLKGAAVLFKDAPCELVTPTGAAILKTFCNGFGAMPAIKIENSGYGAGDYMYPGLPNLLRIIIGTWPL